MRETVISGNERDGMLSLKGIMLSLTLFAFALFAQSVFAADAKQVYEQATNALYNLDFNTAEHAYEMLTRDYPDNPDYWNALASAIWVRITFNQQKLNIESFSGATLGTKDSRDNVNPAAPLLGPSPRGRAAYQSPPPGGAPLNESSIPKGDPLH